MVDDKFCSDFVVGSLFVGTHIEVVIFQGFLLLYCIVLLTASSILEVAVELARLLRYVKLADYFN